MRRNRALRHEMEAKLTVVPDPTIERGERLFASAVNAIAVAVSAEVGKLLVPGVQSSAPGAVQVAEALEVRFVPLQEAAELFGKHPCTLRRWESQGNLPPRRRDPGGRCTGWLLSELRAILGSLPASRK